MKIKRTEKTAEKTTGEVNDRKGVEWYSEEKLKTLLDLYVGENNVAIIWPLNSAEQLGYHLKQLAVQTQDESQFKPQHIIPLNVNALTGELEANTNHWVGLYILINKSSNTITVNYVNPMGYPINSGVANLIKQVLGSSFADTKADIKIDQPLLNHGIQYVEKVSAIELEGNINDCGSMLVYAMACISRAVEPIKVNSQVESLSLGSYLRESFDRKTGFNAIYSTFQKNAKNPLKSVNDNVRANSFKDATDDKGSFTGNKHLKSKSSKLEQNNSPLKEHSIKLKLQEDLDRIMAIKSLIDQSLSNINDSTNLDVEVLLSYLTVIGQSIHHISWDEDNPHCIRNKHGFRDRTKNAGNEVNKKGAKLDFEALAHLKDLATDKHLQWLLITNLDLLKEGLGTLQEKIHFILSKEYLDLSKVQRSEIECVDRTKFTGEIHDQGKGFLKKASAYYHDRRCIDKLIQLLNLSSEPIYQSLDLSNIIDRYWLGYFFVQIGETAKEISDFIKPESGSTVNLTKSLFNKLRDYRQEIKNFPDIVESDNYKRLFQMKVKLEEVIPSLLAFLDTLKATLIDNFKTVGAVVTYEEINTKFEQTFAKETDKIKKVISTLRFGVTNLKKALKNLDKEIKEESGHKGALEQEKYDIQNPSAKVSDNSNLAPDTGTQSIDDLNSLLKNQNMSQIRNLLENFLQLHPQPEEQTFKVFKLNLKQREQECRKRITEKKQEINNQLKQARKDSLPPQEINKIKSEAQKALDAGFAKPLGKIITLSQAIENLSGTVLDDIPVYNLLKALQDLGKDAGSNYSEDPETRVKELEEKIEKKAKLIKEKQHNKIAIEEVINGIEEKGKSLPLFTSSPSQSSSDKGQKLQTNQGQMTVSLSKIYSEIENLSNIEQSKDPSKIGFAKQMCIGFIGEHYKKIKIELEKYIRTDSLFSKDFNNAMVIRHKEIMHGMFDTKISNIDKASKEMLLPWLDAVNALINIYELENNAMFFKQFDSQAELMGTIAYAMFGSNKLGNWDKTIKFFHLDNVQKFIEECKVSDKIIFSTKLKILTYVRTSYFCLGDFKAAISIDNQQLSLIDCNQTLLAEKYSDTKTQILLNRSVCNKHLGHNAIDYEDLKNASDLANSDYTKSLVELIFASHYIDLAVRNPSDLRYYDLAIKKAEKFLNLSNKREYVEENGSGFLFAALNLLCGAYRIIGDNESSKVVLNQLKEVAINDMLKFKSSHGEFYVICLVMLYFNEAENHMALGRKCKLSSRNFQEVNKDIQEALNLYLKAFTQYEQHQIGPNTMYSYFLLLIGNVSVP